MKIGMTNERSPECAKNGSETVWNSFYVADLAFPHLLFVSISIEIGRHAFLVIFTLLRPIAPKTFKSVLSFHIRICLSKGQAIAAHKIIESKSFKNPSYGWIPLCLNQTFSIAGRNDLILSLFSSYFIKMTFFHSISGSYFEKGIFYDFFPILFLLKKKKTFKWHLSSSVHWADMGWFFVDNSPHHLTRSPIIMLTIYSVLSLQIQLPIVILRPPTCNKIVDLKLFTG